MKRFLLYIFLGCISFTAAAQPPDGGQKLGKIQALYIAYVQQELQLTPDEAQRFWPVHAQYQAEVMAVNNAGLGELDKQQRLLDIKKKYQPQFERIIGAERTNRFYPMHDRFVSKLADLKERRMERKTEKAEDGGSIRPNGVMRPAFRNGGVKRQRENMISPQN